MQLQQSDTLFLSLSIRLLKNVAQDNKQVCAMLAASNWRLLLEHRLMVWRGQALNARSTNDSCQNITSLLLIEEMSIRLLCFVEIKLPAK